VGVEASPGCVSKLALQGISPNPAFGAARVRFVAPRDDEASVEVCDIAGPRKGRWIVVGSAGTREVLIATAGWPPGLYAVRISSRTGVATGRLIVAR
jgi:hypothetical protein